MAKKVQYTTNDPSASTDYLAADNTWKTIPGGGGGSGTVTSVAVSVPTALSVSGSPITTSGTIAISGAGTSSQYIKGDGTLGTTPTSLPPNGSAGGDLTGTYPNPTVHRIHGIDMQSGTPNVDEVWIYGGSPAKWQHQNLTKSNVGLGNVDNTSDLSKPISTATQTALDTKISVARSFMAVNQNATVALSGTTYCSFNYSGVNASESARILVIPYACTLKNFYVRMFSAQSATGSLVFTLRKNSADTSVVVTIAAGSAAGTEANSGLTSATYAAGDDCAIKVVNNATVLSGTINNTSIMVEI